MGAGEGFEVDGGGGVEGIVQVDGGVDAIAEGVEGLGRDGSAFEIVGGPGIVAGELAGGMRLADGEIFRAKAIEQDVEGAGDDAVEASVKEGRGRAGVAFDKDAQGVRRVEAGDIGLPEKREARVGRRSEGGAVEFVEDVLVGVVGEADVGGEKLLIEDGSAEEASDLLALDGIVGENEDVADAREDEAGDAAFEGFEESKLTVFEGEDGIGFAKLDAIFRSDGVDALGVDTQGVEGGEQVAGGGVSGLAGQGKEAGEEKEETAKTHGKSVDTFGMGEQGARTGGEGSA